MCGQPIRSFSPTETAGRPGERGMRAMTRPPRTPHLGVALAIALVCLAYAGVARAQVGAEPVSEAPAAPREPPADGDGAAGERAPRGARGTAPRRDGAAGERAPRGARGTAPRRDGAAGQRAPRGARGTAPRRDGAAGQRAPRGARGTAPRRDGAAGQRAPRGARGVRKWRLDRRDQLPFDRTGHRCGFLRALLGLSCGSRDRRRAFSPPLGFRPGQACLAFSSRSAAASDCASSASACGRGSLRRFRRRFLRRSLRRPCRVSHSGSPWVGAGSEPVPYSCAGTYARRRPRTA